MSVTVNCPTCTQAVEWKEENRYRPFCSARCKQIDLGAWAAGEYVIATPLSPNEEDALPDGLPPQ
ncbi:MAG: DNA gyrase inhibitor YacG [Burkholderiaceae bacterium]|nr:MAG: DNA gyrase inhibitor YacG [Burkholderiaceae bacterium]